MKKTYIVDTNVLLDDVNAIENLINGEENKVYIPIAVLYELDKLKTEKPGIVRNATKQLEKYKDRISFIDTNLDLSSHVDTDILESIAIAGLPEDAILVTNDRLLRVISEAAYDIPAQEYLRSKPEELKVEKCSNRFAYKDGKLVFDEELVYIEKCWGINAKTESQKMLIHAILNPDIEVISVNSKAGMGKTFVSLACAMYLVFEKKDYRRIKITRPLVHSGHDIGFLPGDLNDKILNYFYPVIDIISGLNEQRAAAKLYLENGELNPRKIQLTPTNYLRGANFFNDFLIIDEAQNLSRDEIRTVLTRCGKGCKVILLGDVNQVDASYLSKENNALSWCVDKLSGYNNYLHLTLEGKNQRGSICNMVIGSGL